MSSVQRCACRRTLTVGCADPVTCPFPARTKHDEFDTATTGPAGGARPVTSGRSAPPSAEVLMSSVVVVTGSAGLIGSESVRHFAGLGMDVVGVDNDMRGYFF